MGEDNLKQLVDATKALDDRETLIQTEIKERTASRDKQRSQELKRLEEEHSKLSKEVVAIESKLKNRESDLEAQLQSRKKSATALDELRRQVEAKEKLYQKEKEKFDKIAEQDNAVK